MRPQTGLRGRPAHAPGGTGDPSSKWSRQEEVPQQAAAASEAVTPSRHHKKSPTVPISTHGTVEATCRVPSPLLEIRRWLKVVAFLESHFPRWKVRFLHHAQATSPMESQHSWSLRPYVVSKYVANEDRARCALQHVRGPKFGLIPQTPGVLPDSNGLDQWTHGLDQWTPPQRSVRRRHPSNPWRKKPEGGGEKMGIRTHSPRPPQPRHRKKPPPTTAPAL